MEVPFNMKIHAIIEKTALFVSEQGIQMEIIIKVKQQNNPQFAFLYFDNPLYPYYKYLIEEMKCGGYSPKKACESEDDDEDGDYLHPSLLSGKRENVPKFTVPVMNFQRSEDDSYSVLVRNLQQQVAKEKLAQEQVMEHQQLVNYSHEKSYRNESMNNSDPSTVVPPLEIQPVMHKMAEYVAKNGEDFEYVAKSKNDKRLEFLETSSVYYGYYIQLRNEAKARLHSPPSVSEDATVITIEDSSSVCHKNEKISTKGPAMQIDYSVDSVGIPKCSKGKVAKVLKGPISFSLKAKHADSVPCKKLRIPLSLDDSDDDSTEEGSKKKIEIEGKQSVDDHGTQPTADSRHNSVNREEKAKLTSEIDAKLDEDHMKYKLLAAVREKFVLRKKQKQLEMEIQKREERQKIDRQIEQLSKEKQLQLERKRKAALFLKMLEKRSSESDTIASKLEAERKSREQSAENGDQVPVIELCMTTSSDMPATISRVKRKWSESSESEESMITEFCSDPDAVSQATSVVTPEREEVFERNQQKKKKKRSHSRHRDNHSKSYRSKNRHGSRSPEGSKHKTSKREKELPAAYARFRFRY